MESFNVDTTHSGTKESFVQNNNKENQWKHVVDNLVETPTTTSGTKYEMATFALGCFWGGELAFMRMKGVVGTRVGYALMNSSSTTHTIHSTTPPPTYEEVCNGSMEYREVVQVLYNQEQVSYHLLVQVALQRIKDTTLPMISSVYYHHLFDENSDSSIMSQDGIESYTTTNNNSGNTKQYQYGFVYKNNEQRNVAQRMIESNNMKYSTTTLVVTNHRQHNKNHNTTSPTIDLISEYQFWTAEEYHQKYLYKGGQSARIGCKEKIRCYG